MCCALRFWRSVYFDLSPRGMTRLLQLRGTNANVTRHTRFLPRRNIQHSRPLGAEGSKEKSGETKMATGTVERRETASLIGSDKVEGTNVYRSNGDNIGAIERIMIDKQSGKVGYAVMSFGGFLGIGHDHYPVPWSLLNYNTQLGGYEVNISD